MARIARLLPLAALAASILPAATAAAAPPRTAYVSSVIGNVVTPMDVFTGTLGPLIPAGPTPRALAITPDGRTVYVANFEVNTVTPIDTQTGVAGPAITVGAIPTSVAVAPDGATAYVTSMNTGTVTPIDTATNTTLTPIPVPGQAVGIAITPDGTKAYVAGGTSNVVVPIDLAAGTAGTPIPVGGFPNFIAVTPDGSTAYVASPINDTVTPIDVATDTPGAPIPAGVQPNSVAISPDGATAYVTNAATNNVTPIDIATGTANPPIPTGTFPIAVAFSPDGSMAIVSELVSNTVTRIHTATGTAEPPIPVSTGPAAVAITPNQGPGAAFIAVPGAPGSATSFDASGSSDSDGTVASYRWDFGDGQSETTSNPAVAHTYTAPGTYTVTLAVTDDEGCSDKLVFTGQTASCNGSSAARVQHQVTVPAAPQPAPPAARAQAIERFVLAPRCVRASRSGLVRVRMHLRLARRGPVRVQVQRGVGTGPMDTCPKPSRDRRFAGDLRGVELRRTADPRVVAAAISGRLTLRLRLKPGLYRVTVWAYTGGGERTRPARRWLRVLG
jgi:YVTN family beta-propeller protein